MARQTKHFAVDIVHAAEHATAMPLDSAAAAFGFESNADYLDMRPLNSEEARRAIAFDRAYIAAFVAGATLPQRICDDEVDDFDDDIGVILQRQVDALDPGVSGAVAALAASGCAPYTSCNGGAFGEPHSSPFPTVWFYAPNDLIGDLLACAERAGVGFDIEPDGRIEVFAQKIEHIVDFAEAVLTRIDGRGA